MTFPFPRHLIHSAFAVSGALCRRRIFLFQVNERMNCWLQILPFLAVAALVLAEDDCENDKKVLETLTAAGFSKDVPSTNF